MTVRSQANSNNALSSEETGALNRIFLVLNNASPDPTSTKPILIESADIVLVLAIISRWPESSRFPGKPEMAPFHRIGIDLLS